jgi:hypothetical protein
MRSRKFSYWARGTVRARIRQIAPMRTAKRACRARGQMFCRETAAE